MSTEEVSHKNEPTPEWWASFAGAATYWDWMDLADQLGVNRNDLPGYQMSAGLERRIVAVGHGQAGWGEVHTAIEQIPGPGRDPHEERAAYRARLRGELIAGITEIGIDPEDAESIADDVADLLMDQGDAASFADALETAARIIRHHQEAGA